MIKKSWPCVCGEAEATNFCSCSGKRETFLCEGCLPSHYSKSPGRIHLLVPVSAYGEHTVPGYYDRLHVRATQFPVGRDELLANLDAVDACITEFNSKIEAAIGVLREYAQTTVAKLKQVRTDLERDTTAAVEEAERTLYLDHPRLEKKFSRELRDYGQGCKSLQLFKYQVRETLPMVSLDSFLQYKILELTETLTVLPGICGKSIRLYDVINGQTTRSTLPDSLPTGSVYCPIDEREVLCLGGDSSLAAVYSLDLVYNKLTEMQPMKIGRSWPGVIKHGLFVYVFGGYTGYPSTACEKYGINTRVWSQLSSMFNPRHAFSPCVFQDTVCLAGIFQTHKVLETFNLLTEEFKVCPVQFPSTGFDSVSFIADGELVILTSRNQMWRWTILSGGSNFRVSNVINAEGHALSRCPPVQTDREVFWVGCEDGDLTVYSLDTNTIRKR